MLNNQEYTSAEIVGIVSRVNYSKGAGQSNTCKVYCPNIQTSYDVVYNFFCPIKEGDTIYGLCIIASDGKLHLCKPPFVYLSTSKDDIIKCLMRALSLGFVKAAQMYNNISKSAQGEEKVVSYLTSLAKSWVQTRNLDILFMFEGIQENTVETLLNWWYKWDKDRALRRLYLLGLNNKEINATRLTCEEIYNRCITNPFTLPMIPLDKCYGILDRINKQATNDDVYRGTVVRTLWKNLSELGWTGTPTHFLTKIYPTIKDHVQVLKDEYELVVDMQMAYLKFPHKVETWTAEYIINLRKNDPINYDTPLDEKVTLENGDIIERLSAHYTLQLSEDQCKAVQGALDHKLSIITGGAGCGKCLAPGTPVLMFNGKIKKVEHIKSGEYIMGPNSLPREVLSTTWGIDNMYEVIPKYGRSYIFNEPHILTLIGLEPYLDKKSLCVYHTKRGIPKVSTFNTLEEAQVYINKLPEDIFDIPLKEFISRSEEDKRFSYLFHTGVEFPEKEVEIDPYDLGYLLDKVEGNYIPELYKINSRENRMKLLAGLIDSLGEKCSKYITLNVFNPFLLDDIEYLAFSLGLMVIKSGVTLKIFGEGMDKLPIRDVNKRLDSTFITKRATCNMFTIKKVESGIYYGFTLDGDGRFLLGDFLVTHNTTCLTQIVHNLELRGISYALCSFTGKAVARIREVTKKESPSTIHRLIANSKKNMLTDNVMQYQHIIIDEASMVTTELLYDLLQAYPNIEKLTLVGDINQLSPIGWGSLLQQIVKSETVPTYLLTTNYRVYCNNGERDGIILNANAIITHEPNYPFEFSTTNNFSLTEGPIERVYDIIKGCFNGGVKPDQIVVITPYNRTIPEINRKFQEIYMNETDFIIDSRGVKWIKGDRVMLTENDNDIGVFNGEIGSVLSTCPTYLIIDFGRAGQHKFLLEPTTTRYSYYNNEKDEEKAEERTVKRLVHAYALTVDKSQGSEWDFVILYIPEFNTGTFINRNRIYTAITRTKRCCWCVICDTECFNLASVRPAPKRCENLHKRLSLALPNLPCFKIPPPYLSLEMKNNAIEYPDDIGDNGFDCDDY